MERLRLAGVKALKNIHNKNFLPKRERILAEKKEEPAENVLKIGDVTEINFRGVTRTEKFKKRLSNNVKVSSERKKKNSCICGRERNPSCRSWSRKCPNRNPPPIDFKAKEKKPVFS